MRIGHGQGVMGLQKYLTELKVPAGSSARVRLFERTGTGIEQLAGEVVLKGAETRTPAGAFAVLRAVPFEDVLPKNALLVRVDGFKREHVLKLQQESV